MRASPQPAELPLPGGQDGATVRVHPLKTAEMPAPPAFFNRPSGPLWQIRGLLTRERLWLPIPAFLVEHPTAGPFLVDTGMHVDALRDSVRHRGRAGSLVFRLRMDEDQAAPAQLEARGFDPAQIRLVVMTHLHHDHASGIAQFPDATFVVDEREWMAAARGGFREGYHRPMFDHEFDWRTVDLDQGEADLFGDGSVRLLPTRGHCAGHLSVVLRLGGGRELMLAGDAVYAQKSLDEDWLPMFFLDEDDYRASARRVREWRDEHGRESVICSHDAWSWPDLPAVFE